MDNEQVEKYLLSKPECIKSYPFERDIAVFKVKHKMFATLSEVTPSVSRAHEGCYWMNLKCDPEHAFMLRDIFPAVIPGYHMNKKHWNTIILDGSIPQGEVERRMDDSYRLVVSNMTQKDQQSLLIHL